MIVDLRSLPKVELHHHLEGAAPPRFIAGLAREKNVDISGVFGADGGYSYRNFTEFLRVYEAATEVLQTPGDYFRLTRAVLEQAAADGVVYCETFLAPDFCGGGAVGAWQEYLLAIREAAQEAERDHSIVLRGIATCVRHFGPEQSRRVARCAAETADDWLVGFGMAGDERAGRASDFAYAFDMAREAGLRLTAHAGEWQGPDSVRDALRVLRVERLGHGVRAIEDSSLVAALAETGVVLEVCPGSNLALGLYPDLKRHPIAELRARGVAITVSTDDPPFFRTTMTREYEALSEVFGWGMDAFETLNATALDAAFCTEATRTDIRKRLRGSHQQ